MDQDSHNLYMQQAAEISRQKMLAGEGGPFGAVVVRDKNIIGEGWNRVTSTADPTAHTEIVAIRNACSRVGSFTLEGTVIYTSCEPCPMCLGAIWWARIARIYYANTRADAASCSVYALTRFRSMLSPLLNVMPIFRVCH